MPGHEQGRRQRVHTQLRSLALRQADQLPGVEAALGHILKAFDAGAHFQPGIDLLMLLTPGLRPVYKPIPKYRITASSPCRASSGIGCSSLNTDNSSFESRVTKSSR